MKIALTPEARPRIAPPLADTDWLEVVNEPAEARHHDWLLQLDRDRLALARPGEKGKPVTVDFAEGPVGWRRARAHQERLVRACGLTRANPPRDIVDLTGGLARDTGLLTAGGARVTLLERHPLLHSLLADAVARAEPELAAQMQLCHAEGLDWLAGRSEPLEVVYMDPMFPPVRHKSTLKKEQHWLRLLAGEPSPDEENRLLTMARTRARRVVVKRPHDARPLDGVRPHHQLTGKAVRFDVYD
jgi:16S rRNA (guanine1516-N2)-methyltransferase